jgi:hypothetical protein
MNNSDKSVISKLLDDLMHLEIDTIIKKGMTSALQPEEIEDVLRVLLTRYREKLAVIVRRNDMDKICKPEEITSYEKLYTTLDALNDYMDEQELRLEESDYIIFLRMKAFCNYLRSRTDAQAKSKENNIAFLDRGPAPKEATVYSVNMELADQFKLTINSRDKVRIRRLFDLGTERIVLQTRFGIDGDVVTRIEENFAMKPHQVVLKLHEEHTNLSLKYWQSLVNIVVEFVKQIGKKR